MQPRPGEIPKDQSSSVQQGHPICDEFIEVYGEVNDENGEQSSALAKDTVEFARDSGDPDLEDYPRQLGDALINRVLHPQSTSGFVPIQRPRPERPEHEDTTPYAAAALAMAGCVGCVAEEFCLGKKDVEARRRGAQVQSLLGGPEWFFIHSLHSYSKQGGGGIRSREFLEMTRSADARAKAEADGFTMDGLLGGVECRRVSRDLGAYLPEELTDNLKCMNEAALKEAETYVIQFPGVDNLFEVTDLSEWSNYKGIPPNERAYGELLGTAVNWMRQVVADGRPVIVCGKTGETQVDISRSSKRSPRPWYTVKMRKGGTKDRGHAVVHTQPIRITPDGRKVYSIQLIDFNGDSKAAEDDLFRDTGMNDLER